MKKLILLAVIGMGWTSAASAQVFYTPAGDHRPDTNRFYRAGSSVERPADFVGGGLESEYGDRRASGDYTRLPADLRDAAVWSMIQGILEEHLDFAFSYPAHFRGPYLPLGREITADEIRNVVNQTGPRFFRKGDTLRDTMKGSDGATVVPSDGWPVAPAPSTVSPTTRPAVAPKAILIIPKPNTPRRAGSSDKVADAGR